MAFKRTTAAIEAVDLSTLTPAELERRTGQCRLALASDLRMDPSVADEVSATNVMGTRAILECDDRVTLNQALGDQAMVYLPNVTESHPHFDMSHVEAMLGKVPRHPPLDKAAWVRLYHYAADQQFCPVY